MKKLVAGIVMLVLCGCASTTMIKSQPEGAIVFIDGIQKGVTPLEYSDADVMGSFKNLRLELAGYKPINAIIRKDKAQIGPIIGTCLFVVPAAWMLGYQKEYDFNLEKN